MCACVSNYLYFVCMVVVLVCAMNTLCVFVQRQHLGESHALSMFA